MNLSSLALNICRKKCGKKRLYGFAFDDDEGINISADEAERAFYDLYQNEMILMENDSFHVSALGQFIVNMISDPQIFIMI